MLRRSACPVLVTVIAAFLVSGCGAERQRAPDAGLPAAPGALIAETYQDVGVRVRLPSGWRAQRGPVDGPLVVRLTSGRATIAIWRYRRSERLPRTKTDLEATRDSLIAAVKARDSGYSVTESTILRGENRRGVEIDGTGTNTGVPRRARSTHLFASGFEVVLDQYTTPNEFATLDGDLFRPVARSLRVTAPGS